MRRDIERQFGFNGSRYTRVGSLLPAVFAIAVTVTFFGVLLAIGSNPWVDMFVKRGWTPIVIVLFTLWSMMILWIKRSKLNLQRRALRVRVMPDEIGFVLSVDTVDQVIERLYEVSDHPKHFVLLHRLDVGLSNVRNLSRVVDLGEILRTQSDHDESVMETSFNLIRGLVWAIPILGFIGTVSGLSGAIGGFGRVLSQTDDPEQLIEALKGVTGGLATAFETTLLALMAALLVQMSMTFQKKREEEFLDECTEYCQREVLSRLWSPDRAHEIKSQAVHAYDAAVRPHDDTKDRLGSVGRRQRQERHKQQPNQKPPRQKTVEKSQAKDEQPPMAIPINDDGTEDVELVGEIVEDVEVIDDPLNWK